MKKWKIALIVLGTVFFGFVAVCAFGGWWMTREVHVTNWKNAFADRPGTYATPDGRVFEVGTPKGLVTYELRDPAGKVLLKTNEYRASDFHRWFFYMDDKNRLWFYSGDIGVFVWLQQADGVYTFTDVPSPSALAREMPSEFFSRMGSAMQRQFSPTK